MEELPVITIEMMVSRLLLAMLVGGLVGYERRLRHKAIGIAGMVLVAMGSASYMLLARYVSATDPAALGRAVQGILQGIGFLGGAVIFKGGTDVRGIKSAAAIWITGAAGLAIATELWWMGIIVGLATFLTLLLAEFLPRTPRQTEHEEDQDERAYGKVER